MFGIKNSNWKEDGLLKDTLVKYSQQGYKQVEILDFIKKDFPFYAWSERTLRRRLNYFDIYHTKLIPKVVIERAVKEELDGPGKLLGYRAMQKKLRQVHGLPVARNAVRQVLLEVDKKGVEKRRPCKKNIKEKAPFTSKGPNWVHSLDGHDKLMGFQNHTFPIAVYGCLDTCSRKLLWIKVWPSNSEPNLIAKFYLEYLCQSKTIGSILRIDRGTETGTMATMHAFLRKDHGDMDPFDTVIYGPSTSNQIERWWKELHERLEKYFKQQLNWLKDQLIYNPNDDNDRMMLAFLMVPIMQREIDIFVEVVWNTHRIRDQKDAVLPSGVPNYIYDFPERYGLCDCGWKLTEAELENVAILSGVLEKVPKDFLTTNFRNKCQRIIPDPSKIKAKYCADAFCFLKSQFTI